VSLADSINATIVKNVLTQRSTVYSRTGANGPFTTVVKTGLACFLFPVDRQPGATSSQRADLASLRRFMWDATYDLPETGVQIEVTSPARYAGRRWNIQSGTHTPADLPGSENPAAMECDVRRAS
jgi:hypothetical protein